MLLWACDASCNHAASSSQYLNPQRNSSIGSSRDIASSQKAAIHLSKVYEAWRKQTPASDWLHDEDWEYFSLRKKTLESPQVVAVTTVTPDMASNPPGNHHAPGKFHQWWPCDWDADHRLCRWHLALPPSDSTGFWKLGIQHDSTPNWPF